jgi:FKBP-type peptidyl-prolyl cis-trans isomerase
MRLCVPVLLVCAPLAGACVFGRPDPPSYPPVRHDSGLLVRDLMVPEKGAPVAQDDLVTLHYELSLADGTEVESSRATGLPLHFTVGAGEVPPGLEQGVLGMRLFGRRRIELPSPLAFGAAGRPPRIPPDAPVVFEVELIEHVPAPPR